MRPINLKASAFLGLLFLTGAIYAPEGLATPITIYSYVGNPFTHFHGADACPNECRMTGFFAISGRPPINLSGTDQQFQFDVTPIAYSFSDGSITATNLNGNADFFDVSTDAAGNITYFNIRIFSPPVDRACLSCLYTGTQLLISTPEDVTTTAPTAVDFAANLGSPGTWTTFAINVAEPSSLWLLMAGLLVLAQDYWRKRKTRARVF